MAAQQRSTWVRAGAGLTALTMIVTGVAPAVAQTTPDSCAGLTGAEEVACLRQALTQTQEALARAEQALELEAAENIQPAPAQTSQETLGAEQAARRAGIFPAAVQTERLSTLIVASERIHPNRLQVRLENGQVWRQIQGDTQIVEIADNAPVSAEIWNSGFGGYRMRLPDIGRTLKVERIR